MEISLTSWSRVYVGVATLARQHSFQKCGNLSFSLLTLRYDRESGKYIRINILCNVFVNSMTSTLCDLMWHKIAFFTNLRNELTLCSMELFYPCRKYFAFRYLPRCRTLQQSNLGVAYVSHWDTHATKLCPQYGRCSFVALSVYLNTASSASTTSRPINDTRRVWLNTSPASPAPLSTSPAVNYITTVRHLYSMWMRSVVSGGTCWLSV